MTSKTPEYLNEINQTWASLKDFQKKTVDYVFDQLYNKNRKSFLIADEVGLGKTIIAKGLIAKAFQAFSFPKGNPTFNVIYICSNQSLAKTNLRKLNFSRNEELVESTLNRLIYLAYNDKKAPQKLRFDSLTPSTSFNLSNKSGVKDERAIIYALLVHYNEFKERKNGLKWLLKSSVDPEKWKQTINKKYANRNKDFRADLFEKYKNELQKEKIDATNAPKLCLALGLGKPDTIWNVLLKSIETIDGRNYKNVTYKNELIFLLRHILTKVCLEYLSAELIILDEFQRYSNLIDQDGGQVSPAVELARAVFELKDTKVLMLSATPFKPFTTRCDEDAGENHYQEFIKVLRFLMSDKDPEFWLHFEEDRRKMFSLLYSAHENGVMNNRDELTETKYRLQDRYLQGMVRTERTLVSDNKNLMVKATLFDVGKTLSAADIKDYLALDIVNQKIGEVGRYRSLNPIEFSKSCPYALSFLSNYSIRNNLKTLINNPEIALVLKSQQSAWIDLSTIKAYKPLGKIGNLSVVPNARLQELLKTTVHFEEAWRWLWIPPTLNYYNPDKIYPIKTSYSKTLLFSSWLMVPRAISTILSYESERMAITSYCKKRNEKPPSYFADIKKRKPGRLLQIRIDKKSEFTSMNLLTLVYPSEFLRDLYDPEQNVYQSQTLHAIVADLEIAIKKRFNELKLDKYKTPGGESDRWYWAALLLFDHNPIQSSAKNGEVNLPIFHSIIDSLVKSKQAEKTEKAYLEQCKTMNLSPENLKLGDIPRDLFKVLAMICLASPAITFSRSLLKNNQLKAPGNAHRVQGYIYAQAMMRYLDKPESITVIRSSFPAGDPYWEAALKYCLEGNLQSVTDEYVHMLTDCDFIHDLTKIREKFEDVLALRTVNFKIDDYSTVKTGLSKNIRTHFAVDFGNQDIETEGNANRRISVRDAFNSPFRPFVLASTSIGQEGLDFHYYCSRLVHWNLPHNAIDLEQREGRVNRYKSHIIRKNLVVKYSKDIKMGSGEANIWDKMFALAKHKEGTEKGKCDLVPYWHIEPFEDCKIERLVPLYPFSKDIAKYSHLKEVLAFYRMTFGQPRQEELVEVLQKRGFTEDETESLIRDFMIDLTPPKVTTST